MNPPRACHTCGRVFVPIHPTARYCGFGCAVLALTGETYIPPDHFVPNNSFERPSFRQRKKQPERPSLYDEMHKYSDEVLVAEEGGGRE